MQEISMYQQLINRMRETQKIMKSAMRGEISGSSSVAKIWSEIHEDEIPTCWNAVCHPVPESLQLFLHNLSVK